MQAEICAAVEDLMPNARTLFEHIATLTAGDRGVTREAFGARETAAGTAVAEFARSQGLASRFDHVGNLHVGDGIEGGPWVVLASHLDSVPNGGNFDGLAGVIAGVVVQASVRRVAAQLANGVRTIAFRGEESPWFGTAYLGSKLALGQFKVAELAQLKRFDTGRSLLEHLRLLGCQVTDEELEAKRLRPEQVSAYLELHIEQGPLLEAKGLPVALATALRGNIRHPFARCIGRYAHSAAVPREHRSDAVLATAKLLTFADELWRDLIADGHDDLVFTCGILQTDAAEHAMTKVSGDVAFAINIGGTSNSVMEAFHARLLRRADELAGEHRTAFELGPRVGTPATPLDEELISRVERRANASGLRTMRMPTVGHDAAMFARLGVPAAVILVRNQNGSHNPDERMEMDDFREATKVLALGAVAALQR